MSTRQAADWIDGVAKLNPGLVVRVNGRRMVTSLAALRKHFPDLGKRIASFEEIDDVREEQIALRRDVEAIAKDLAEFRGKAWSWYKGAERRLSALEKVRK
jgi:hypothetical protein